MKTYFYYKALRKTVTNFLDAFNDIKIIRYKADGVTFDKYVEVPIKLAGKEKVWHWLNQRKDDKMLPMITSWISSIDYAQERKVNGLSTVCQTTDNEDKSLTRFLNPSPYNITFTMSIWSLYMSDTDQIIEQILPYFDPYIMIKIYIPELNSNFDVKVLFQSCTPEVTNDMPDEEYRVINYTMDFQVQTFMFKPVDASGIIDKIITQYSVTETAFLGNTGSGTVSAAPPSGGIQTVLIGQLDSEGNQTVVKYEEFE